MNTDEQKPVMSEFNGRRALVTGGTRGIGEAVVKRLIQGGATVITTARRLATAEFADMFIEADVSTREGVDRVIEVTFERLGGLDILVNCVGGSAAPSGGALA